MCHPLGTNKVYEFPIRSFSYWKGPSKEVLLEQGEIPLLFLLPAGIVYFIFPHISLRLRQSSRAARARP